MQTEKSLYWYDFESFGSDPRVDRACQFAGVRTDENLNIIDDPLVIYCQPSIDVLPDPEACLITGITPQIAAENGITEVEFATRIQAEFSEAKTCVAGYNNLRFDDEITRRLLYRCFFDPYEREWKNGNSRWDIIDLVRMTYALRPEGINWPLKEDGRPSFKLETLTQANNISHEDAHDALSDVYATIALAKLIKEKQPKLYDYYYSKRHKNAVLSMFNLNKPQPLLHISSRYPASRGCMAVVLPLLLDPSNPNGIIVYDLAQNPAIWIDHSVESIKERLFTSSAELEEGVERIALKTLHSNRCPALAPLSVLTPELIERFDIDMDVCESHQALLMQKQELKQKLALVFQTDYKEEKDPDLMLYSGGFFDKHDRSMMNRLRQMPATELAVETFDFHDARLPEMLFRYRCRNYPDSLNEKEKARWYAFCREKLSTVSGQKRNVAQIKEAIATQMKTVDKQQILLLEELNKYIDRLSNKLGIGENEN